MNHVSLMKAAVITAHGGIGVNIALLVQIGGELGEAQRVSPDGDRVTIRHGRLAESCRNLSSQVVNLIRLVWRLHGCSALQKYTKSHLFPCKLDCERVREYSRASR